MTLRARIDHIQLLHQVCNRPKTCTRNNFILPGMCCSARWYCHTCHQTWLGKLFSATYHRHVENNP